MLVKLGNNSHVIASRRRGNLIPISEIASADLVSLAMTFT